MVQSPDNVPKLCSCMLDPEAYIAKSLLKRKNNIYMIFLKSREKGPSFEIILINRMHPYQNLREETQQFSSER